MNKPTPINEQQPGLFGTLTGDDRIDRTRSSMLWAAYADALGFISELVDSNGLKRRTKGAPLDHLMSWKRRVGGRGGVDIELPSGCWSDDTQLRMAVSRSISNRGFDVEAFARVELPVWPSYALGGGRASKGAAANLAKTDSLWYANTFAGWAEAGGNGAAMRIQPHVWAATDPGAHEYVLDVIMDSVCTHGHPRAIVGAAFHAATLAHCLSAGAVPDMQACVNAAAGLTEAHALFDEHQGLRTWRDLRDRATDERFADSWKATVDELLETIESAFGATQNASDPQAAYQALIERLALDSDNRGSGILTAVAAVALAGTTNRPHEAAVIAAAAVGTDTDTIGTMAGSLLGAANPLEPVPEEPLDSALLIAEADRLVGIASGQHVHSHSYPDLLTWAAPQTQADAVVMSDGQLAVEGLGRVTELNGIAAWSSRRDFAWQWVRTTFGQTLIVKRRPEVRELGAGNTMTPPPAPASTARNRRLAHRDPASRPTQPIDRGVDLDAAVNFARDHIGDNHELGYTVRRVARDGTVADLVALVVAVRDELRR